MALIKPIAEAIAKRGVGATVAQVANATKDLSRRQRYKLLKNAANKGFKTAATRAATIAAIAKSNADAKKEAAKANAASYQRALEIYQSLINQNAAPAEGTGEPSSGSNGNSTTGDSGTGPTPVGNK